MSTQSEIEEITDERHPLVALLKDINPSSNTFDWVYNTNSAMELTGNSYSMVFSDGGMPSEMWHLAPQWTRPEIAPDGTCKRYIFGRPSQERPISVDEVMHFMVPNPFGNPWHGYGPLHAVIAESDISLKLSDFASSMLDNGGYPGGIIDIGSGTSPNQIREAREQFESKYAGPRNAGRWVVLGGSRDGVKVTFPPQYDKNPVIGEAEQRCRDVVAAAFDIPIGLLNMEEMSLANGQVVAPHWQMMSIRPRCIRIENMLNEKLVPRFRSALKDDSLFVCFENPVGENQTELEDSVVKLTGNKSIITVNEGRARLGMPPIEGGDDLVPESPDVNGPSEDATANDKPERVSKSLSESHWDSEIASKALTGLPKRIADAIKRIFDSMVPVYARAYNGMTLGVSDDERDAFVEEMRAALRPNLEETIANGYREESTTAFVPQDAVTFLDDYTLRTSNRAVQSFEGRVNAIVQSGLRDGKSVQETAAAIRTELPDVTATSATLIARTEYSRALNVGKDRAWQDLGVPMIKSWLLSSEPCAVCVEIHEKHGNADVGSPFVRRGTVIAGTVLDYSDVWGGDAHPNCSCGTSAKAKRP